MTTEDKLYKIKALIKDVDASDHTIRSLEAKIAECEQYTQKLYKIEVDQINMMLEADVAREVVKGLLIAYQIIRQNEFNQIQELINPQQLIILSEITDKDVTGHG